MMEYKLLLLIFLLGPTGGLPAQSSCLRGIVTEEEGNEPLPFATVQFFYEGAFVAGVATDLEGRFDICELPDSGFVDLKIDYTGFSSLKITNVPVNRDSLVCKFPKEEIIIVEVLYTDCSFPPLIEPDNMTSGQTFYADQIRRQPSASYDPEAVKRRQERRRARRENRRKRKAMHRAGGGLL